MPWPRWAGLTGSSESVRAIASLDELAGLVDLSHISRHATKFDSAELSALSAKILHAMSFETVRQRPPLASLSAAGRGSLLVRGGGNLAVFAEVNEWMPVVFGKIEPITEDAEFALAARHSLPAEPWDGATFGRWTRALKQETKRQGRALFHPLRLALTGRENGPELAALLPLMGYARASARLSGSSA